MRVMGCRLNNPYANFKAQLTVLNANKDVKPVVDEHKSDWKSQAEGIGTEKDNVYLCILPSEYRPGKRPGTTVVNVPAFAFANINGREYYDELSLDIGYDDETEEDVPNEIGEYLNDEVSAFMNGVNNSYLNPDKYSRRHSPR